MKPSVLPMCLLLFFALTAKITAQPIYRLTTAVVEKTDLFQLMPQDSVQFYYTGNNGGAPNDHWLETLLTDMIHNGDSLCRIETSMKFDSARIFDKNGLKNIFYHIIDGSGNITKHTKYERINATIGIKALPYDSMTCLYDAGARLQRKTKGPQEAFYYYYDAQGRTDSMAVQHAPWISNDPNWNGVINYDYNAANDIEHIHYAPEPLSNYLFRHSYYTYYAQGKPENIAYMDSITSPPSLDTMILYHYTYGSPGQAVALLISMRDNTTGYMENVEYHDYTWDANGHKATEIVNMWDSQVQAWKPNIKYVYTYNSYNLPAGAEMQQWDISTSNWMPWMRISLKYVLDWPLQVKEQAAVKPSIRIYPNPATDVLTMEARFENAGPFTATIRDMQGRVLKQWNGMATKNYNHTVPISDLANGNYILQIGNSKTQFTVVSQ